MTREEFARNLQAHAARWVGTPFVWHGQTRYGADCLGVTVGTLREAGIPVPSGDGSPYETHWFLHDRGQNRYLEALLAYGYEVPAADKQPGDILAFWNQQATPKVIHSGLYLGHDQFLHTRRGNGATIDRLTDPQFRYSRITVVRMTAVERELAKHV